MSKKILLLLLGLNFAKAQSITADSIIVKSQKKNEVSLDILQLVWPKIINITYERFIRNNTSVSINPIIFEGRGFDKSPKWFFSEIQTHSFLMRYNFYVNPNKKYQGFAFSPLVKYSTSFKDYPILVSGYKSNKISDFLIGSGIIWKYIKKDKFGFQLGADIQMTAYSKKFPNRNVWLGTNIILNTNINYRL